MTEDTEKGRETRVVLMEAPQNAVEDEINLIELIRLLIRAWKLIGGVTVIVTGAAFVYALLAPEAYRAETLLAPAEEEKTNVSSALSQFGGLATLAGVSIPADSNKEQVLATLRSRKFLQRYIEENNLLQVLFEEMWDQAEGEWKIELGGEPPTEERAYRALSNVMDVREDKKTGLITLSILWKDPEVAAKWANDLVSRLNARLQKKAIEDSRKRIGYLKMELSRTTAKDMLDILYSLIESEKQKEMLVNVNEEFALEVIDPAVAPELRESPKRKLIVVLGGSCGILLGTFVVFLRQFLRKLRASTPDEASA